MFGYGSALGGALSGARPFGALAEAGATPFGGGAVAGAMDGEGFDPGGVGEEVMGLE